MIPLLAGTFLALAALSFVLYPLLVPEPVASGPEPIASSMPPVPARNHAVDVLREIEFDRATGKLSDSDYAELKSIYTQRAVEAMRPNGALVCNQCGPRPEADARFCSNCGLLLAS